MKDVYFICLAAYIVAMVLNALCEYLDHPITGWRMFLCRLSELLFIGILAFGSVGLFIFHK